ncbi:hypothetical protein DERP_010503, partial [Dermatophagoides pteronyssinus]
IYSVINYLDIDDDLVGYDRPNKFSNGVTPNKHKEKHNCDPELVSTLDYPVGNFFRFTFFIQRDDHKSLRLLILILFHYLGLNLMFFSTISLMMITIMMEPFQY